MGKLRISCDDGCASDRRLAELCKKFGVDCTFYWPIEWQSLALAKGYKPLKFSDAYQISKDFEIGAHTITHRLLTQIPYEEAETEIAESYLMLESFFNTDVKKFCPPRGYTNEELTEFTLKIYESQRLTKGPGLVHVYPLSGANNNKPWRECIDEDTKELWMHSYDLDKYDLWKGLEEVLSERR